MKTKITFKSWKLRVNVLFCLLVMVCTGFLNFSAPTPAQAAGNRYIGSFMNKANRTLKIITSNDGLNFTTIYDGGFKGVGVTLRDPSIFRHTDGRYYVAYTATNTASCCDPESLFGIAVSSDLVNWSNYTTVGAGISGVINTWAPEWFVDSDGSVNILVSINTSSNNYTTYRFRATNSALTAWAAPVAIIGPNVIDTIVVKVGSVYHAFPKNATTQYIEHATASNLNGPYTYVGTGDWAGWGTHREGPTLIHLDNSKWRMYLDTYSTTGYLYSEGSSAFTGWTAPAGFSGSTTLQHGTVYDQGGSSNPTPTSGPTPTPGGVTNLAQGKTASADSSQSANPAGNGNDGNTTTRWCAANSSTGHWWKVDLGSSRNITKTEVMWEKSGQVYKYKVETSMDNSTWTLRVDKTANTSTAQTQTDSFSASARYVRITVTGLPSTSIWASFFEFRVFGN
ncbi:MAG TPA: discoidin domain-containing protein [Bacillota bacterium]|nr:discoidin domain-containing protein [Bacillota bacterium]